MNSNLQNAIVHVVAATIVIVTVAVIIMDSYAIYNNQAATGTISDQLRYWNAETGGLLALTSLGLWIHLFVKLPYFWTEKAARDLRSRNVERL